MNRLIITALIVGSTLLSVLGAHAAGANAASTLIESEVVRAPRAYTEFCRRRPEICPARSTKDEVDAIADLMAQMYGAGALGVDLPELTPARMARIERVNSVVNAMIRPVEDARGDVWTLSPVAGDCEEYVLMKREMLARLGLPRSALRITVVRGADYEYHAVLVVSTSGGDLLLDNMVAEVTRVERSPYEFVVSQSLHRPGEWVRVNRR